MRTRIACCAACAEWVNAPQAVTGLPCSQSQSGGARHQDVLGTRLRGREGSGSAMRPLAPIPVQHHSVQGTNADAQISKL